MQNITGQRIKELRQAENLTQKQLGEKLNVSQDTISLWEIGKSLPSAEDIIRIAKIFNESADYILGLKDD